MIPEDRPLLPNPKNVRLAEKSVNGTLSIKSFFRLYLKTRIQ